MTKRSNWTEAQREKERTTNRLRASRTAYEIVDGNGVVVRTYKKRVSAIVWCYDHDGHAIRKVYLRDEC